MEGLYKKITKGKYSRIPSIYSNDMMRFLKLMLNLKPKKRPSAEKLLNQPIIIEHMNMNALDESYGEESFDSCMPIMRS